LICYFCHIQTCNDDCWVICIVFANVKSLFDHVTRRYDIARLGAKSERQDRHALSTARGTAHLQPCLSSLRFAFSMDRIAIHSASPAPQVGLNEFQFGKGSLGCCHLPLSETIAGQCTPHRRWILLSENP